MPAALKRLFPIAAAALIGGLLLFGDGALAIVVFAGCIALVPVIYGDDVDEIARATRAGEFNSQRRERRPYNLRQRAADPGARTEPVADFVMALVVFRSRAAAEIYMFTESARRIFEIIGKADAPRGVITAEQVPQALALLQAAVDAEREQLKAQADEAEDADRRGEQAPAPRAITLGQRAFPLLAMLRAAQADGVEVTWGV